MERELKVGQHVIFIDSLRKPHDAVVTAAWTPICCNLVIVSDDAEKTDSYGRQIERYTSVCKASAQGLMRKISELSREELLSLIYHELPKTYYGDHPCECASCGTSSGDGTWLFYLCDDCERLNDDWNARQSRQ